MGNKLGWSLPLLLGACGTVTTAEPEPDAYVRPGDTFDARPGDGDATDVPPNSNGDGGGPPAGMIAVPGGSYWQGCTVTDPEICGWGATPYHQVYLEPYWIDRTEVSQATYAACIADGTCPTPTLGGFNGESKQPVAGISWSNALRFCQWRGGRLPTEAEWERAARGTATLLYPWGDQPPSCDVMHGECTGVIATYDVDQPAGESPVGALNMAGNVAEWIGDWYDETYYSRASEEHNPRGPASEPNVMGGARKVVRGGAIDERNVYRYAAHWRGSERPDTTSTVIGFRCAWSAP